MIKFLLLVNKQGQVRVVRYYEGKRNRVQENEVIKKCFTRTDKQCSFFDYREYRLVYRKYATLFFIVGVDDEENELAVLEFIHNIVETFDKYFKKVIMYNLDRVHMILDEMILNGQIVESNKTKILAPLQVLLESSDAVRTDFGKLDSNKRSIRCTQPAMTLHIGTTAISHMYDLLNGKQQSIRGTPPSCCGREPGVRPLP
ncbi:hypothetical protein LSH36_697g00034 [Paralvinella palmiformis]|uniref:AP-4 complex subunit sigma-1 n=1 Tax=Paralvinella palmiformis TaxID=53620 RepID=A0AAD9MVB1_9ANNE|nr:hypothetical protein LSH36_697g00034 [Paralvinella palmiformis]